MSDRITPQFDITSPSPFSLNGRISIKASAGTGKTYSLTTTVARLVAEHDLRADQLLLMTFTNEATAELRLETRKRCQEALAALVGGGKKSSWVQHMDTDNLRSAAIQRLTDFLARYDEVTVSTIHGFCQAVLRQAGLDGLAPSNFEVAANVDDVIDQAITDLLAQGLANDPARLTGVNKSPLALSEVGRSLNSLREVVRAMLNNDGSELIPAAPDSPLATPPQTGKKADVNALAQTIADDARKIVAEVRRRCRRAGVITYNDMIRLVAEALDSNLPTGQRLATQLASQYPVIMVDEFQDTDAVQWSIFRRIFESGGGNVTLLTVGDPKQAIYRFRGADVNVYLSALKGADEEFDLGTNRRSDKPLLDALQTLLGAETFDVNGEVVYTPVSADPGKQAHGFAAASGTDPAALLPGAPLEIRYIPQPSDGNNTAADVAAAFSEDLTTRVIDILNHGLVPDRLSDDGLTRAVRPSDIAILVHSHSHADRVVRALQSAGVAAVRQKTGSVFQTEAARHWLMLLRALANPGRPRDVRTYALSWFGGLDEDVLERDDVDLIIDLQRTCAERAELLQLKGITALYLAYRNSSEFLSAVLSEVDGLRNLTDLDHIAEILGSMPEFASAAGPFECLDTLNELIDGADGDSEEQKRRIETDRESVTVMTIHVSKGLQFPIVILPTLNNKRKNSGPIMFPAELFAGKDPVRVIDAGSKVDNAKLWEFRPISADGADIARMEKFSSKAKDSPGCRDKLARADADADNRRLFYVAMTRAMHKVICYWAPYGKHKPTDPFIGAVTHAADLTAPPVLRADLRQAFDILSTKSQGTIDAIEILPDTRVVTLDPGRTEAETDEVEPVTDIHVATFGRDGGSVTVRGFGNWSYSSITKRLKGQSLSGTSATAPVPLPGASDESNVDDEESDTSAARVLGWDGLPAGAGFGNGVHHVLDIIDPAASDLSAELASAIDATFGGSTADLDVGRLNAALATNLTAPLDQVFGGVSLAQLGRSNRLSEMRFDFALPAEGAITIRHIVALAVKHGDLPSHILDNFERLTDSTASATPVAGFMNGSIDAVFRVGAKVPKFVVCDYKTNKLHKDGDTDPIKCYDQASMEDAMLRDGYFFQAMIYSVALQRYLRHRLHDYDFETHFGGVSYLFLRGLTGESADDGSQFGHYFWQPGRTLVDALDGLFSGIQK